MAPNAHHDILDLLTRRYEKLENAGELAFLASAMTYGHLVDGAVHEFCRKVAHLLCDAAWDGQLTSQALEYLPRLLVATATMESERNQRATADCWGATLKVTLLTATALVSHL